MKEIILKAVDVGKRFDGDGERQTSVLNHVSLELYERDFTVIMGASGAGKSTLLYALSGMDRISSGQVQYKGQDISMLRENRLAELRAKEFGFVFQQTHLVSNLTILENAMVAGFLSGVRDAKRQAEELLKRMGVAHVMHRLPHQVSGGEAQRAAIARAMMGDPGILFADEPTGALNKKNSQDVLDLLTALNRTGQTMLMVTHDLRAALRGNRILYLEDGRILAELSLCQYLEDSNLKAREEQINGWLSELSW